MNSARSVAAASPVLPPALPGLRRVVGRRVGGLGVYVAGTGPPLLLVHSLNAAASAYEVRPVALDASRHRTCWAFDLPGFGHTDRGDRDYNIRLFVDAVHDVLDLIGAEHGPVPVHGLALSTGAEFLARAAVESPGRLRSLTLVTPTGFGKFYAAPPVGEPGASREIKGMHKVLTGGPWRQPLYDLLVSRRSIRFFLKRTWGSDAIDDGLAEYDWLTAHQPGAARAPYAFISGRLFSRDIQAVYAQLSMPVWMPHGTRGDFSDFSQADRVRGRPNWTVQSFEAGALPHYEHPEAFNAELERFLAAVERADGLAQASSSAPSSPRP